MDAIDCFFPGEKEGESYKDRALNGLKSLVKVAFNAILGNSAAGECSTTGVCHAGWRCCVCVVQ